MEWVLKCIPIEGDGNCFFRAIAVTIVSTSSDWHTCLNKIQYSNGDLNIEPLNQKLRKVFTEEILGENHQEYEQFLEPFVQNYEEEVHQFTTSGFYDSPIGNAMPLALATALQCSIVTFSQNSSQPTMCASPLGVDSKATAFVVYDPRGSGHYNAALPMHTTGTNTESDSSKSETVSCRCGVNKKLKATSCMFKLTSL